MFGPRREKTCLRGFRQSEIQTSLPSYRDALENRNFTRSKFTYETYQKANNKGAEQSARMRRLVCVCVVRKPPKTGFLALRPMYNLNNMVLCYLIETCITCDFPGRGVCVWGGGGGGGRVQTFWIRPRSWYMLSSRLKRSFSINLVRCILITEYQWHAQTTKPSPKLSH